VAHGPKRDQAPQTWTEARAHYGALKRHHGDDPEWAGRIAEAREALRNARMDDEICRAVAAWEPLPLEQRARIAVLLLRSSALKAA
jgi:hypothetical protein